MRHRLALFRKICRADWNSLFRVKMRSVKKSQLLGFFRIGNRVDVQSTDAVDLSYQARAKGVKKKANFFAFFSRRAKPLCEASVRQFLVKKRVKGRQSVATDLEAVSRAFLLTFFAAYKNQQFNAERH
jgi:hypothetical protein